MTGARRLLAISWIVAALGTGVTPARGDSESDLCFTAKVNGLEARDKRQLVAARKLFIRCSQKSCDPRELKECLKAVEELDQLIPTLDLEVRDEAGREIPGFTLRVDGVAVAPDAVRLLRLDPGAHTAVVESTGMQAATREFELPEGDRNHRELVVLKAVAIAPSVVTAPPIAPSQAPLSEPPRDEPLLSPRARKITGVGLGALGVGGLVVGTVYAIKTQSTVDDAAPFCTSSTVCNQHGLDILSEARGQQTTAIVFLALGGAALAGGIVLYATAPPAYTEGRGAPTVAFGAGPGGVFTTGRW